MPLRGVTIMAGTCQDFPVVMTCPSGPMRGDAGELEEASGEPRGELLACRGDGLTDASSRSLSTRGLEERNDGGRNHDVFSACGMLSLSSGVARSPRRSWPGDGEGLFDGVDLGEGADLVGVLGAGAGAAAGDGAGAAAAAALVARAVSAAASALSADCIRCCRRSLSCILAKNSTIASRSVDLSYAICFVTSTPSLSATSVSCAVAAGFSIRSCALLRKSTLPFTSTHCLTIAATSSVGDDILAVSIHPLARWLKAAEWRKFRAFTFTVAGAQKRRGGLRCAWG